MTDSQQPQGNPWDMPTDSSSSAQGGSHASSASSNPYAAPSFGQPASEQAASNSSAPYSQPSPYADSANAAPAFTPAGANSQAASGVPGGAQGDPVPAGEPAPGTDIGNDLGKGLQWALKAFAKNLAAFLVPALVWTVVSILAFGLYMGGIVSSVPSSPYEDASMSPASILMLIAAALLAILAGAGWSSGAMNAAGIVARGEKPTIGQGLFSVKVIITNIATGLICLIGYMLCYVPGLVASVLLWAAPAATVVDQVGVGGAIGKSIEVNKKNIGLAILTYLVMGLIVTVLSMTVLGLIVAMPFAALFTTAMYMRMTGRIPSTAHAS